MEGSPLTVCACVHSFPSLARPDETVPSTRARLFVPRCIHHVVRPSRPQSSCRRFDLDTELFIMSTAVVVTDSMLLTVRV